jgi:hypothetical protein
VKFEYYVLYKGCVDGCLFLSNFIRFGEVEFQISIFSGIPKMLHCIVRLIENSFEEEKRKRRKIFGYYVAFA